MYLLMVKIYPKYKDYEEYITGSFALGFCVLVASLLKGNRGNTLVDLIIYLLLWSCGIVLSYFFIVHGKKYKL